MTEAFRLGTHPLFGNSAFAARSISKGDIVLRELPLLTSSGKSDPFHKLSLKLLLESCGEGPSLQLSHAASIDIAAHASKMARRFLPWFTADEAARTATLERMQNTAPEDPHLRGTFAGDRDRHKAHMGHRHGAGLHLLSHACYPGNHPSSPASLPMLSLWATPAMLLQFTLTHLTGTQGVMTEVPSV